MSLNAFPVLIPLLAAAYLLVVYGLLNFLGSTRSEP